MIITTNEKGNIQLEKVYNGVTLKTSDGELMHICMRDSGFEFRYQGAAYFAKEGVVGEFGQNIPSVADGGDVSKDGMFKPFE